MGTQIFAQKVFMHALTDVFIFDFLGKTPKEKFEGC